MVIAVKNLPTNAGDIRDTGSIPGSGRSLGGGQDNPFQYSCLENLMDRGVWRAAVTLVLLSGEAHGQRSLRGSRTRLKQLSTSMQSDTTAYLTSVQSISCEMPGQMNHKLESRVLGEVSTTSNMQMMPL